MSVRGTHSDAISPGPPISSIGGAAALSVELTPGGAAPSGDSGAASTRFGAPRDAWYPAIEAPKRPTRSEISCELHGELLRIAVASDGTPTVQAASGGAPWSARSLLGLIWVCAAPDASAAPPLVEDEGFDAADLAACSQVAFRADYDQAVLGLVDPAHVPMIHRSWWWYRSPKRRRVKTKRYAPSPFGFTATALDRFVSAPIYRILGDQVSVSIEFRLPSVRVERIVGERGRILNLTTVTPTAAGTIVLRNRVYSTVAAMRALRGPFSWLGQGFLEQDARMLRTLDEHAAASPRPLFVGDPDRPSLWYFASKAALQRAQSSGAPYSNPVEPTTLTWRT